LIFIHQLVKALSLLKKLHLLIANTQQQHHATAMAGKAALMTQQICTNKSQATSRNKQHWQGAVITMHALQVQSLTDGTLGFVSTKPFNQLRPKMINRLAT